MTDVVNKIIAIFLIACMLLIAPLSVMRHSDRVQNEITALNAMEVFLDTVADAHQIDNQSYERLAKTLESCGITATIYIDTYDVTISDGKTYMWKTSTVSDLTIAKKLELGDIIALRVEEQTTARTHDLWGRLFGSSASIFDHTLMKMIK